MKENETEVAIQVKDSRRLVARRIENRFGKDLAREVAELITNSADSYRRLKETDANVPSVICVRLGKAIKKEKDINGVITVIDNAEGMTIDRLKEIFGNKGSNNSGGDVNQNVRGFFGLGASDCLQVAAHEGMSAEIITFKDGACARLRYEEQEDHFDIVIASISGENESNLRNKYGIKENGTAVTVGIPKDTPVPHSLRDLKSQLEGCFLLWKDLHDQRLQVILKAFEQEEVLSSERYFSSFQEPPIEEKSFDFPYQGQTVICHLNMFENKEKVAFPVYIEVVDDRGNIYDNSDEMFGFANRPGADQVSGMLSVEGFYQILKQTADDSTKAEILNDNRSGLETKQPFYKALNKAIKPILNTFFDRRDRSQNVVSTSLRGAKGYDEVLKYLNLAIKSPDSEENGGSLVGINPPSNGLAFARKNIAFTIGITYSLKLFVNRDIVPVGSKVIITSLPLASLVFSPETIVLEEDDFPEGGKLGVKTISLQAPENADDCSSSNLLAICNETKLNNCTASCCIVLKKETVIEPRNGFSFENENYKLVPGKKHTISLFYDSNVLPVGAKVSILCDSETKVAFEKTDFFLDEKFLIPDSGGIGKIDVNFNGGSDRIHIKISATCAEKTASCNVYFDLSAKTEKGKAGDISSFEFTVRSDSIVPAYFNRLDSKDYIYIGYPTNSLVLPDSLIDQDKMNLKQIRYCYHLVAHEAAILWERRQVDSGKDSNYEGMIVNISKKQNEMVREIDKILYAMDRRAKKSA